MSELNHDLRLRQYLINQTAKNSLIQHDRDGLRPALAIWFVRCILFLWNATTFVAHRDTHSNCADLSFLVILVKRVTVRRNLERLA